LTKLLERNVMWGVTHNNP